MEPTISREQGEKPKAGLWKDLRWSIKQNISDKTEFYELELKIKRGLTENMVANTIPHNQASGHGTKGKSLTKPSKECVKKTQKEKVDEETKGQKRNEDQQKKPVTTPRSTKGPSGEVVAKFQTPKLAVKSSIVQEKQGFGSGSGPGQHTRVPEEVQSGSRSTTRSASLSGILERDYLVLLKSLRINLPNGVLNPKVIKLSQKADIIQKALDIVKELENFKLKFNSIPRLGCREVKNSLSLKDNRNVVEITLMIFFEKTEDSDEDLRTRWEKNVLNTKCEFKFRDKYKTVAISTPAMYATTQTRSWRCLESGDHRAILTDGVTLNISDIEKRKYCEESTLWKTSSSQKFGKYFQNPEDENECLKFYHELHELGPKRGLKYTKGNKVEFGFLSGRLDFLAKMKSEKIVIECKGTTGDMVDKVFSKPRNGNRAQLIQTHEYYYQVQAYMYILNKAAQQAKSFTSNRAVFVIRHYHENGQKPRDFYWNYVRKDTAIQQKINELCVLCEEEVLACFLAVLNLIFQKDT